MFAHQKFQDQVRHPSDQALWEGMVRGFGACSSRPLWQSKVLGGIDRCQPEVDQPMILEICAYSPSAARQAWCAGADRVELCDSPSAGGISPPSGWFSEFSPADRQRLVVMVRPDGGGFVYSAFQLDQMIASITWLRENAMAGAVVFGALTADGEVDCVACRRLIQAAQGLPCVFHRAFEQVRDHRQGLADLIDCGFQRLLCGLSLPQLVALKSLAGERLTIMPGGGIRSHNMSAYLAAGFTEIHSSARLHAPCLPDESELAKLVHCVRQPQVWA